MTGRIEKTVFISYRRTNFWTALAVFQNLYTNGYDVFFDYKSIPSGDFEQVITENVKSRAHFIVILSPSALERCNEPGDWLRREIEIAIDNKRNIIPLMMEGFDFGSPTTLNALTGKLGDLKKFNAMGIPAEYFDDAMIKLRGERFLNRPLESVSYPISSTTKQITEEQKFAATEADPVEKRQLTAQEWYERGYVFRNGKIFDEAIRCFTEAIQLDSTFAKAYVARGLTYEDKGDKNQALQNYSESIRADASDYGPYVFRGFILEDRGDFDGAIQDFTQAIQIKPDDYLVYVFQGLARLKMKDTDGAIKDFTHAINLNPNAPNPYSYRASALEIKKDYLASIADYKKYIELNSDMTDEKRKEIDETIKSLQKKINQ